MFIITNSDNNQVPYGLEFYFLDNFDAIANFNLGGYIICQNIFHQEIF